MSVRFSVIIPTYNHAHSLQRAMDSVRKDNYGDYELILIDDGSTDNTNEVVKQWTASDFSYFYKENQGVSIARNFGASRAVGHYLVFLDADDWLSDNFLSLSSELLTDEKSKLLLGYIAHQNNQGVETSRVKPWKNHDNFSHSLPGAFVIEKELFHKIGGYDSSLTYSENTDLFLRLNLYGNLRQDEVVVTDQVGVWKENVDAHDRNSKYARKRLDSATYFLTKHGAFFSKSKSDYRNFKRIQAVAALQLGEMKKARMYLSELIARDPIAFKTWLQFLFVLLFPWLAKAHYIKGVHFVRVRLAFEIIRDFILLFVKPSALQHKPLTVMGESFVHEQFNESGLPLVISFGGLGGKFEFRQAWSGYQINAIFLRDLKHQWYLNELNEVGSNVAQTTDYLLAKIKAYSPSRVIVVGASAGGFAALLYGTRIQAHRILAFSPQSFRTKWLCLRYLDYRWLDRVVDIYAYSSNRAYLDLKKIVKGTRGIDVYYDRTNRLDRIHAERLRNSGVQLHQYMSGGHTLVAQLKETGELDTLLKAAFIP